MFPAYVEVIPAQRSVVRLQGIQVRHGRGVIWAEDAKDRPSGFGGTALSYARRAQHPEVIAGCVTHM